MALTMRTSFTAKREPQTFGSEDVHRHPTSGRWRMARKELPLPLTPMATLLLATLLLVGCEFASPDSPASSVVLKQGVDSLLVIVLLVLAFAGGWHAHKKLRSGELRYRYTDGYDPTDEEPPN